MDVSLGTVMYGGALYRQRGGVQDFASFDGLGTGKQFWFIANG
jgi:hypothetical protein